MTMMEARDLLGALRMLGRVRLPGPWAIAIKRAMKAVYAEVALADETVKETVWEKDEVKRAAMIQAINMAPVELSVSLPFTDAELTAWCEDPRHGVEVEGAALVVIEPYLKPEPELAEAPKKE